MTTWITSDIHLCHKNSINYCPSTRGQFVDVDSMNEYLVRKWNDAVQPDDTVYILGDIGIGNEKKIIQIVQRLQGNKILIEGNHDVKLVKNQSFRDCFTEIHRYHEIYYNKHHIMMFHYPIQRWNLQHHGSIHFHGHLHGDHSGLNGRAIDVGFDATGNVVSKLDGMIEIALAKTVSPHHGNIGER